MLPKTLCRSCLASNIKMHDLRNTQLQQIFEKLMGTKLNARGGFSRVCYICYSQLQRCSRFLDMALKADALFQKVLSEEFELTGQLVGALRATNSFMLTPVDCMSLPMKVVESTVTIKIEQADIKELIEDDSGLLETIKIEDSSSEASDLIVIYNQDFSTETTDTATENPNTCNLCYKTFKTTRSRNRHISAFHNENKLKACNKKNSRPKSPLSDIKNIHTEENMSCDVCGKSFDIKKAYLAHMRTHTKPYTCHLCDKAFSERSSLRKHAASHSGLKPFICGECNKRFTLKKFLTVHIRTHTGERPFSCDLCPKTFTQIGHASSHKRTHQLKPSDLPVRPFKCTVCQNSFTLQSTLRKHMRIHTGERPYACGVCDKTFSVPDTVRSHMRTHTGEKPFACAECGKSFSTSGNRRKHLRTHERTDGSDKM